MNTYKAPKRYTSLIQTDIFTAFKKWNYIKEDKDLKKIALSDEIIVIEDSDSESNTISPVNTLPNRKRPLKQPFSDDEDEQVLAALPTKEPLVKKESSISPVIKRPLRLSFSSDGEDSEPNGKTGRSNETISNKPYNGLTQPIATSTPISGSILKKSDVDTHDISHTSQIDGSRSSVSPTDLDKTVLVERNSSHQRKIQIINEIIVLPEVTQVTNTSSCSKNESVVKKRCAEQENSTKKPKTNHTSPCKSGSATDKNSSAFAGKRDLKWLSKENKQNCETSKRRPTKKERLMTEKTSGKEADVTLKVSGNIPDCSKNKDIPDRREKSPLPKISGNSNKKCTDEEKNNSITSTPKVKKGEKRTNKERLVTNTFKTKKERFMTDKTIRMETDVTLNVSENIPDLYEDKNNPNERYKSPVPKSMGKDESNPNLSQKRIDKETSLPAKPGVTPKQASSSTTNIPNVKKEEKGINKELLILITDLFRTVVSSNRLNNLLDVEKTMIHKFISMHMNYQYVCLKLFTRQKKWYNAFKFCNLIKLDMEETDVCDMVRVFEENGIVDTDYMQESAMNLLQRLNNTDLKDICDKFRLKRTLTTKEEMITRLLKHCNTQSTLTVQKTTKDLLMEQIQCRMGRGIKISEAFENAFYSTYVLGTFTNSRFSDIQDYINSVLYQKVVFPTFPIDDYPIFISRKDFMGYTKARKYRATLETCTDHLLCLQVCKTIFAELKTLENDNSNDERFTDAPHLIRFTAKAVYVSTLSFMVEKLFCKFPDDARQWLEYMIKKVDCPHMLGYWYYHLIWLYMRYLKPFDYGHAAKLLIHVLHKKREHLSEVQLYQLRKRGEQLICTVKYKLLQMHHDLIAQLLPKPIGDFPELPIDANAIRSNDLGKKRNYEIRDSEGNKTIYKVEDIALKHYLEELRYTGGSHCEGGFVKATFTLFFFDIIYSEQRTVPGAFVSKIQSEPLDMNSRYFYLNRKEQIDRRLREIESEWSDEKVVKFLKGSYEKHSHEFDVCEVDEIIKDDKFLETLVECVGRKVLAKIYQRLVQNFREYRSGLPDLLVWNTNTKQCKFVEVKGENDKLSVGQTLWLDYLQKSGANIEVCHVHSIGSKRKVTKFGSKSSPEASTSSFLG